MLTSKECLVCGNKEFKEIYNNTLLQCSRCSFITANLEVSEEILKNIYNVGYFEGEEYANYLADKYIIQKNFQSRLQKIIKIIGRQKIRDVVEIGCAYGFFGELIQKEGIPYKGYDIAAEAVEYARDILNLNAESINYLESKHSGATDIFMWDVIEHLSEPDKFFNKIHQDLETGGRVYITTGDIGALVPTLQKEKWRMIHPPSHLQYFSKVTLTKFLERQGFRLIHYFYPPLYRSIRQIFYSLFMLNKNYGIFAHLVYKAIPTSWYIPINTRDIIFVIAEKI